jgi:hypothetical protein
VTTESAVGSLLREFFDAVSFPAGARPDYAAIHDLFIDEGRLINTVGDVPEVSTVEQFVAPRQAAVDAGVLTEFREVETDGETRFFGSVAHRFSSYTKTGVRDGVPFTGHGMISTQFVRTPHGWRISVMAWDDER